jgi:hypothetical protein
VQKGGDPKSTGGAFCDARGDASSKGREDNSKGKKDNSKEAGPVVHGATASRLA